MAEELVCPVCKRPVQTVVKRRKVLGAFVPVWGPGPCRHADCAAYVEDEEAGAGHARHSRKRHKRGGLSGLGQRQAKPEDLGVPGTASTPSEASEAKVSEAQVPEALEEPPQSP
ncbi:hypothetical protein [Streptomyces sp. NBC_01304]|uniref:hypothetical protein n=1 Tax=Streptomyces sp. NBC_01304 TaxID=2903818 RepID=UPI002E0D438E|nr:hypothetical protein OG430_17785 [Streptomyces sp. NBC_01304]